MDGGAPDGQQCHPPPTSSATHNQLLQPEVGPRSGHLTLPEFGSVGVEDDGGVSVLEVGEEVAPGHHHLPLEVATAVAPPPILQVRPASPGPSGGVKGGHLVVMVWMVMVTMVLLGCRRCLPLQ